MDFATPPASAGTKNRFEHGGSPTVLRDRRLGRGLAALLGTPIEADPVPASGAIPTNNTNDADGSPIQSGSEGLSDDGLDLTAASTAALANPATTINETGGLVQLPL